MQNFCLLTQARAYKSLAGRISISNTGNTDVAMPDGRRIIVPARAVATIIKEIHRAHSGIEKTYKTTTHLYNWPGMKNSIRQAIDDCNTCREDQPRQPKPTAAVQPPSAAEYPMNHMGTDLFDAIGRSGLS